MKVNNTENISFKIKLFSPNSGIRIVHDVKMYLINPKLTSCRKKEKYHSILFGRKAALLNTRQIYFKWCVKCKRILMNYRTVKNVLLCLKFHLALELFRCVWMKKAVQNKALTYKTDLKLRSLKVLKSLVDLSRLFMLLVI